MAEHIGGIIGAVVGGAIGCMIGYFMIVFILKKCNKHKEVTTIQENVMKHFSRKK